MSTASFVPTSPETALVNQVFNLFDPQKLGVITGDVAVKAFTGARLPPIVLRRIWDLADEDNKGWLSRRGVFIAVRLIGWAQKGQEVSRELLASPGPLPSIEGLPAVSQHNSGPPLKSPTSMSLPPLTTQDRTKFHSLFYKANPQNGLISAEKARELFLKSKLSNDQLSQIWNLADTQDRGALDITDFTIGMYFIQALMSRHLSVIPLNLPSGLYQQAAGSSQPSGSHLSNNSGSFSPTSSNSSQYKASVLQSQSTGQSLLQPGIASLQANVSTRPIVFGSSPFPPSTGTGQWDVTPREKDAADQIFNGLDVYKRGYIEGDVAVPIMLKSNLPGEDLARVWDLADLDNNGRLTRDGFALALHLIQKRVSGQELPGVLPPSLVPPSLRNGPAANSTPYSPVIQHPPEPVNDLFSFDETPPASGAPSQITGETAGQKFMSPSNQKSTTIFPHPSSHNVLNDPFNPSSSFTRQKDLLGDDDSDERAASPLEDKSAEIGNAQNQLNSTNRSLETAKAERGTVEQLLADQAVQLSALQTQISAAKAAYDAETKLLANLKERQTNQLTEIQKLREELIHAESDLSAIRVEKAEMEGTFLRDKEDARELHRKMLQVSQEADRLRQELERVKKEAKQQKGLLAIAKKQLTTKEAEKTKMEKELGEAVEELTSVTTERELIESEQAKAAATLPVAASPERGLSPDSLTFAAQHPLPSTPEIQGEGVGRSNNPFDKFNMGSATAPDGPWQTNATRSFSFENVFMVEESTNPKDAETVQLNGTAKSNVKPSSSPLELILSPRSGEVASPVPDSELFETPPTSSSIQSGPSSPAIPSSSSTPFTILAPQQKEDTGSGQSLEATVAQYPTIEDLKAQFPVQSFEHPGSFPPDPEAEQDKLQGPAVTDLNEELKEIDADGPDSDDEIPLAELTKEKKNEGNTDLSLGGDNGEPSKAIFDDIFGVTPATTEPMNGVQQPTTESDIHSIFKPLDNALTSPLGILAVKGSSNPAAVQNFTDVTGISAFDAALGRIPSQNEVAVSNPVAKDDQFTFDDNFDFSSSTGAAAHLSVLSSEPPLTSEIRGPNSVDPAVEDGFKLFTPLGQTQATATDGLKPFSFDEAFSNPSSRPSVDTANDRPLQDIPHQETTSEVLSSPKTFPSTTVEAKFSPRNSDGSPESLARSPSPNPQRTKSPPKRISSPKSRQSASSTKEEKQGNLQVRHSKLSLRLPFVGKKKKQQEVQSTPVPSSQNLSALREQRGSTTNDDATPVKQITSMGFERAEAIEALERNAYDVQKALNALLGTQ